MDENPIAFLGASRQERPQDLSSPTMPVPTSVQYEKNIWVAAGDGDLERVRVSRSTTPDIQFEFF